MKNTKRWTTIFWALANVNRLKIIHLLSGSRTMSVTDIAAGLEISFKATSNHLVMLKNLDVLEARGTTGHVFYSLNPQMPQDFRETITLT